MRIRLHQSIKGYLRSHPNYVTHAVAAAVAAVALCIGIFIGHRWEMEREQAWKNLLTAPEPEYCAICGEGWKYHAPCIVDLTAGTVVEFAIYDPHPRLFGEIAEDYRSGVFCMSGKDGIVVYRDPGAQKAFCDIEQLSDPLDPQYFCRECRALLADYVDDGYVILDLYDPDNIKVYKAVDEGEIHIRDYTISIEIDRKYHKVILHNTAHVFDVE